MDNKEFVDQFKNLIDSQETQRQHITEILHRIADPLFVVKLQMEALIKKPELLDGKTKLYEDCITGLKESLGLIEVLSKEIFPFYLHMVGLEAVLWGYTKEHSNRIPLPIHYKNEIPKKRLSSFQKYEQLNIYRIYANCEVYLIFHMHAIDLDIKLSEVENEICFEFTVNKSNPYLEKNKESERENNESIIEGIKTRLFVLGGRIDKKTDWTSRITLYFPLP